jgi:hypothetical protein
MSAPEMLPCGYIQLTEMQGRIHIALTLLFYTWLPLAHETFG